MRLVAGSNRTSVATRGIAGSVPSTQITCRPTASDCGDTGSAKLRRVWPSVVSSCSSSPGERPGRALVAHSPSGPPARAAWPCPSETGWRLRSAATGG